MPYRIELSEAIKLEFISKYVKVELFDPTFRFALIQVTLIAYKVLYKGRKITRYN